MEGDVTAAYSYFKGEDHLFSTDRLDQESTRGYVVDGKRLYLGDELSHTLSFGFDVGLRDRFALSGTLAWVSTMYDGRAPYNFNVDDGQWHGTLQDAGIRIRGQVLQHPVVVTPFVGYGFPTTNYEFTGHAAQGRHIRAFTLGLHAGASFLRRANAEGRYAYAIDEENSGLDLRRHQFGLNLGYFLLPTLNARLLSSGLWTTGGHPWVSDDPGEPCSHCEGPVDLDITTSNSRYIQLGGGVSWRTWDRVNLYANVLTTVWGENVIDSTYLIVGSSFEFRTPWARKRMWY